MPVPPRGMEDVYTIEEVELAFNNAEGYMAETDIRALLDFMKWGGLTEIEKRALTETQFELLDWALPAQKPTLQFVLVQFP